jgi:hypothetical protein
MPVEDGERLTTDFTDCTDLRNEAMRVRAKLFVASLPKAAVNPGPAVICEICAICGSKISC